MAREDHRSRHICKTLSRYQSALTRKPACAIGRQPVSRFLIIERRSSRMIVSIGSSGTAQPVRRSVMYRQRKAIVTLSAAVRAGLVGAFICLGRADAGVPLAIGSDPDELPTLAPLVEKIAQGVVYIEVRSRVEQPKYPILKIRSPDTSSHSNDTAAEGSVGKPIRGAERAAE